MTNINTEKEDLARSIERYLFDEYGPLLTGESLRKTLCYPSLEAMHVAILKGQAPGFIFSINNRRGKFALAMDVANWIAEHRYSTNEQEN